MILTEDTPMRRIMENVRRRYNADVVIEPYGRDYNKGWVVIGGPNTDTATKAIHSCCTDHPNTLRKTLLKNGCSVVMITAEECNAEHKREKSL